MPMMLSHDTSIDYDIQGDGPFLLLINGLGFGRWAWFKQVPALSRHFRTITFDIRGEHSLSRGVADLCAEAVALLDHLGVEKAHVLGTSLGGFVAQKLALERPDLVDHLMLVCTSYGAREPQPMSFQALGKMLGGGSLSPERAARQGLEGATSDSYRAEHPEEFDLILRWRLADSSSLSDYYQQMMAGISFDAAFEAKRLMQRTGETNEKVLSVFKSREPHETDYPRTTQIAQETPAEEQERPTLTKIKGWLRWPFVATSTWTRRLRDRLSR